MNREEALMLTAELSVLRLLNKGRKMKVLILAATVCFLSARGSSKYFCALTFSIFPITLLLSFPLQGWGNWGMRKLFPGSKWQSHDLDLDSGSRMSALSLYITLLSRTRSFSRLLLLATHPHRPGVSGSRWTRASPGRPPQTPTLPSHPHTQLPEFCIHTTWLVISSPVAAPVLFISGLCVALAQGSA